MLCGALGQSITPWDLKAMGRVRQSVLWSDDGIGRGRRGCGLWGPGNKEGGQGGEGELEERRDLGCALGGGAEGERQALGTGGMPSGQPAAKALLESSPQPCCCRACRTDEKLRLRVGKSLGAIQQEGEEVGSEAF